MPVGTLWTGAFRPQSEGGSAALGGGQGCAPMGPVVSDPPPPQQALLTAGEHTLSSTRRRTIRWITWGRSISSGWGSRGCDVLRTEVCVDRAGPGPVARIVLEHQMRSSGRRRASIRRSPRSRRIPIRVGRRSKAHLFAWIGVERRWDQIRQLWSRISRVGPSEYEPVVLATLSTMRLACPLISALMLGLLIGAIGMSRGLAGDGTAVDGHTHVHGHSHGGSTHTHVHSHAPHPRSIGQKTAKDRCVASGEAPGDDHHCCGVPLGAQGVPIGGGACREPLARAPVAVGLLH